MTIELTFEKFELCDIKGEEVWNFGTGLVQILKRLDLLYTMTVELTFEKF